LGGESSIGLLGKLSHFPGPFRTLTVGIKLRRKTPLGFRQLMSGQITQLSRQFAALILPRVRVRLKRSGGNSSVELLFVPCRETKRLKGKQQLVKGTGMKVDRYEYRNFYVSFYYSKSMS
jgi:hypothetical protein